MKTWVPWLRVLRSTAIAYRKEYPRTWLPRIVWFVAQVLAYRVVATTVIDEVDNLRHWLSRGRPDSPYWTPRVGEWARGCQGGRARVVAVSIRRDEVLFLNGRVDSLRHCVVPAGPEEP